jgi:hypothetical protein
MTPALLNAVIADLSDYECTLRSWRQRMCETFHKRLMPASLLGTRLGREKQPCLTGVHHQVAMRAAAYPLSTTPQPSPSSLSSAKPSFFPSGLALALPPAMEEKADVAAAAWKVAVEDGDVTPPTMEEKADVAAAGVEVEQVAVEDGDVTMEGGSLAGEMSRVTGSGDSASAAANGICALERRNRGHEERRKVDPYDEVAAAEVKKGDAALEMEKVNGCSAPEMEDDNLAVKTEADDVAGETEVDGMSADTVAAIKREDTEGAIDACVNQRMETALVVLTELANEVTQFKSDSSRIYGESKAAEKEGAVAQACKKDPLLPPKKEFSLSLFDDKGAIDKSAVEEMVRAFLPFLPFLPFLSIFLSFFLSFLPSSVLPSFRPSVLPSSLQPFCSTLPSLLPSTLLSFF